MLLGCSKYIVLHAKLNVRVLFMHYHDTGQITYTLLSVSSDHLKLFIKLFLQSLNFLRKTLRLLLSNLFNYYDTFVQLELTYPTHCIRV